MNYLFRTVFQSLQGFKICKETNVLNPISKYIKVKNKNTIVLIYVCILVFCLIRWLGKITHLVHYAKKQIVFPFKSICFRLYLLIVQFLPFTAAYNISKWTNDFLVSNLNRHQIKFVFQRAFQLATMCVFVISL